MQSISYPGDEHYDSAALQVAAQIIAKPRALVELYVVSQAAGWILLLDDAAGPHAFSAAKPARFYPIQAGGFVSVSVHGGKQFKNGIYVALYSTLALAQAGGAPDGGANLIINASYRRGMLPNS